ncbi:penicillin-binding protein 1C [Roseateles aquae]
MQLAQALPSFEATRSGHKVSDIALLDREGVPIQTLRLDKQQRVLPWVSLAEVSPALLRAMLYSEDRRFYEHSGVDWSAVASSAWANLWNSRTRGASTLSMQLVGLLEQDLARPREGRSPAQKVSQLWLAGRLEAQWSKAQILEAYLNRVPLRGDLIGVPAAALALFDKSPAGLDAREAALLAALLRAPNAKPALVAQRACVLLQVQGLGKDCAGLEPQAQAALQRRGGMPPGEQLAPHYARLVLRREGPNAQRSSLSAALQRQALALLRQQLGELQGHQVEDGAVIVLDNASGAVLAWVGSSGSGFSDAPEVDAVLARRQPGSTLKPFVYELALERRLITAASLLDDSPAQIQTGNGLYLPQNYDKRFRGWVSARTALGNSLNVPAVRVGAMLGADPLAERLNALGLKLAEPGGYYGAALALGSADVSLLALANAYRTLANGGVYSAVALPGAEPARRRVAEAGASFIVTQMLADNNARALTFGLDSALATSGFAAVKTGTSKDMRDNWCVGFSDRFTVGVWVGNASGEAMHQVSGVSGAAPVWAGLMRWLHRDRPSRPPLPPAGVLALKTQFEAAREADRMEWFLAGSELARVQATAEVQSLAAQGIKSPRDGSVYALDPDIPPRAQRLRFEGEAGVWQLDGRRLGQGAALSWAPMPGRHELRLLSDSGKLIQSVRFEVRGASLRR